MPQEYIYSKKFQEGVHFEQEAQFAEPPHSLKDAVDPDHLVRLSQLGALGGSQVIQYESKAAFPLAGEAGKLYVDKETNLIYRWDGVAYILIGDGIKISDAENNELVQLADGLFVPPSIQNGLISGGQVTWKSDYTYSVQAAIYKINGIIYASPYTEIILAASDPALNRIDVFAVTSGGAVVAVTGIPSANPEQPAINTGTQLQVSFALVVAGSVSPVPAVSKEAIYMENAGTPSEWAAVSSAPARLNNANISFPYSGATSIQGLNVENNDTIVFTRSAPFKPLVANTTLSYWLKTMISTVVFPTGVRLFFRFKNGGLNVGQQKSRALTPFGFDGNSTEYQKIVIDLEEFGLTASDTVDTLEMTIKGANGSATWFYIDNMELQGTNVMSNNVGTTDNVGTFYVSKNYSGIGDTLVSGYTLASIVSGNTGYTTQLQSARMGDANKAYPCPWSARNAAMTAMTAGQITKALVVINGGNTWSYGSTNSAQNGSLAGVSATATVADNKFTNGANDVQSLLKNNIDYHFNPNSGLTNICKSFAIYVGWQLDLLDTSFKSSIYGHGNFTTIYGTLEGLSTRFIDIDNANAEVNFEANTCVFQRASIYVQNYKHLSVIINKWIGGLRDTVIYERGSNREGDGSPMNLNVNIKTILSGTVFFPYPIAAVTAGSALFEFAGSAGLSTTRQKNKVYNINSIQHISNGNAAQLLKGQSADNLAMINVYLCMNINNYIHKYDPTMLAFSGGLISLFYDNGGAGAIRQNTHWIFNIKNADVEACINYGENSFTQNAGSINNSVEFNIGYIRKKVTFADTRGANSIFCLPLTTFAVAGEKPTYIFNVGEAIADVDYVFTNSNARAGAADTSAYIYNANCIITGVFKTKAASPPIYIPSIGSSCVLKDAVLISGGASSIDGSAAGKLIYCKDVLSNVAANVANVTVNGVLTVDANITNYL